MFEKDVLQLIRGLRSHKGQEREYIQSALRECKKEIKSNDMDQKATALLKLVYLEMFGHDMGWASFNVLEVMSSQKYPHKRIGYLAAVQSFRPDTEVLMLAENLLKKDLTSPDKTLIHLPLNAIPHLINPSMANSLLADLLPRLSHSHPAVKKKTIVTLYRLAVVYPETLRPAWPKIKERLLDEDEDPTVTAAIVNVVCELGWRRPQDFLPLAPRLFELLTQGGNNWMAIKIIKLFSQLTPLEPRLVRKLLPPLTNIIKTTPAMSLLYECINGIIQGGIMEVAVGTTEGDEVARLCVSKLRAMLVVQGDPNLRYVALLAFAKITASHADLVADHQDVILECIDDADISIRTRALDLVVDMVNSNNLQMVVERLLKQLKTAGKQSPVNEPENERVVHEGVIPMADDDDEGTSMSVRKKDQKSDQPPPLPEDYRQSVIERILEMCSKENYSNMDDFEWYVTVLVELVKQCPSVTTGNQFGSHSSSKTMADAIGEELRNVAVRVKGVRPEAAAAAQSLLLLDNREDNFAQATESAQNVLAAAAFIAGEYSDMLPDPRAVLASLTHSTSNNLPTHALASYIQAIPKVFATLTSDEQIPWTESRRSEILLLIARITHFLEPLNLHPSLEIQERAVEYLDLMRLASEAVSAQQVDTDHGDYAEPPLLLTQAIPSLFTGMDLNPVAPEAVRNVAAPEGLDLDALINSSLEMILQQADYDTEYDSGGDEVRRFYYEKPSMVKTNPVKTASEYLEDRHPGKAASYQEGDRDSLLDPEALERKRAERRERYRDDPFYIDSERNSGTSTPMHSILRSANGSDLDVDAIPVMELKLDSAAAAAGNDSSKNPRAAASKPTKPHKKPKRHFEITSDETLDGGGPNPASSSSAPVSYPSSPSGRAGPTSLFSSGTRGALSSKKNPLEFNSAGLSALSLEEGSGPSTRGNTASSKLDFERRVQEEEDLARAMREVERKRLEMQRAAERVEEPAGLEAGTVVKRKGKKKVRSVVAAAAGEGEGESGKGGGEEGVKKKKKKKKVKDVVGGDSDADAGGDTGNAGGGDGGQEESAAAPVKAKKKKKRQVTFDEP
jgi:AP-3 complex subunit delta-1